jgi:type IV pilus assembly protein PilN
MRLDINLATQSYEDARQFWLRWGSGLFLVGLFTLILLFFCVSGIVQARRDDRLIDQTQERIAERNQEKARAEALLNQPQNRAIRDRSQYLNDLFERKAFSWTRVFEDLENLMPSQLHVTSIQPDLSADNQLRIKLVVAGNSRVKALQLVRKMEESHRFHQTHIDQERTSDKPQSGDTVQFEITAVYIPDLPTVPSTTAGAL